MICILTGAGFPAVWGGLVAKDFGSVFMTYCAHAGLDTSSFFFDRRNNPYHWQKDFEPNYETVLGELTRKKNTEYQEYLSQLEKVFEFHMTQLGPSFDRHHDHPARFLDLLDDLGCLHSCKHFTLNQDVFLEAIVRSVSGRSEKEILVDHKGGRPHAGEVLKEAGIIHLHGCYAWSNVEPTFRLVTGDQAMKRTMIDSNALYRERFDLFSQVLLESRVLWVIGYSFGDKYVNDKLHQAMIDNRDLKIVINDVKTFGTWARSMPGDIYLGRSTLLGQFASRFKGFYSSDLRQALYPVGSSEGYSGLLRKSLTS